MFRGDRGLTWTREPHRGNGIDRRRLVAGRLRRRRRWSRSTIKWASFSACGPGDRTHRQHPGTQASRWRSPICGSSTGPDCGHRLRHGLLAGHAGVAHPRPRSPRSRSRPCGRRIWSSGQSPTASPISRRFGSSEALAGGSRVDRPYRQRRFRAIAAVALVAGILVLGGRDRGRASPPGLRFRGTQGAWARRGVTSAQAFLLEYGLLGLVTAA